MKWIMSGPAMALLLLPLLVPGYAGAATLYEWVDAAGETHYGYRPPPGVVGTVVGERTRQPQQANAPVNCKALQDEHLRLIDKEIARLRNLPVGMGPEFEFTAEARQRFINDLLAHRAALLTGRSSEEFSAPNSQREINQLKEKFNKDEAKLKDELESEARQLRQERIELERQRRENDLLLQRNRAFHPGYLY